jgi:hypothetical protein
LHSWILGIHSNFSSDMNRVKVMHVIKVNKTKLEEGNKMSSIFCMFDKTCSGNKISLTLIVFWEISYNGSLQLDSTHIYVNTYHAILCVKFEHFTDI